MHLPEADLIPVLAVMPAKNSGNYVLLRRLRAESAWRADICNFKLSNYEILPVSMLKSLAFVRALQPLATTGIHAA